MQTVTRCGKGGKDQMMSEREYTRIIDNANDIMKYPCREYQSRQVVYGPVQVR